MSWVVLTKVVGKAVEFSFTESPEEKFLPLMASVIDDVRGAMAVLGEMFDIEGVGVIAGCGAELCTELPPQPVSAPKIDIMMA